ncbi:MAG: S8 family serine peptidase [Blastocatellia bacterium]
MRKSFVLLIVTLLCVGAATWSLTAFGQEQQQQEQQEAKPVKQPRPKLQLAPPDAQDVRDDEFSIAFGRERTSLETFERELPRILAEYNAKPLPGNGKDGLMINPDARTVFVKMSMADARRLAENEPLVLEVWQNRAVPISIDPGVIEQRQLTPRDKTKRPRPQRQHELEPQGASLAADSRFTIFYNLDRIDERPPFFNSIYEYTNGGNGVDIYFFDTGVNPTHAEFGQRMTMLYNPWPSETHYNNPPDHGTKVASVALGSTTGVANQTLGFMLRMLRVNGGTTSYASGAQWTVAITLAKDTIISRRSTQSRRAIINCSFKADNAMTSQSLKDEFASMVAATGVPVFVGAGQNNTFSVPPSVSRADWWPQNAPYSITVGMADNTDERVDYAYFWNGTNIVNHINGSDIFAPAGPVWDSQQSNVLEDGIWCAHSLSGLTTSIGTSLAAPQAAGVAAMYLAVNSSYQPSPVYVKEWLVDWSSKNYLFSLDSSDFNRLIYTKSKTAAVRNGASFAEGLSVNAYGAAFGEFGSTAQRVDLHNGSTVVASGQPIFANSTQVNFTIGTSVALGQYQWKAYDAWPSGGNLLASGPIQLNFVAPGFHYQAGNYALGQLYKTNLSTGEQTIEAISTNGNFWNPATHSAYLVLYGTGSYNSYTQGRLNVVQAVKGATIYEPPIYYFNMPVPNGQDQLNIGPLPTEMGNNKGTYDIKVYVGGTGAFPSSFTLANIVKFQVK